VSLPRFGYALCKALPIRGQNPKPAGNGLGFSAAPSFLSPSIRYTREMAYRSSVEFLAALERAGELVRVPFPVATELEITAWADREMKSPGGGKALLFEKPTLNGVVSSFPLAVNTMGSRARMALALGIADVDDLMKEMRLILKAKPPTNLRSAWTLALQGLGLLNAKPNHVRTGPAQEVVHRFEKPLAPQAAAERLPTLLDLPILQCWPDDGGRFITLPCVHTKDPDNGERNLGMYRIQIFDRQTTGMHWQVHKVGARHGKRYYEKNEPMPVAVTIGGDPAYAFAATAPCRMAWTSCYSPVLFAKSRWILPLASRFPLRFPQTSIL